MMSWYPKSEQMNPTWTEEELTLYRPDGSRFQTLQEIKSERDAIAAKATRLAQRLRELGVNPDEL